jgi:translation elongation factor EF-1alpha
LGRTSSPYARPTIFRASGHLTVKDQRGQDRIVPAPDDDLPFVLNVESACWITGRGTVIMGVIEQGVLHIGDHLETIQPSSAGTALPGLFRCSVLT